MKLIWKTFLKMFSELRSINYYAHINYYLLLLKNLKANKIRFLLFVIPNNTFEKLIPFFIQKTLRNKTLEFNISTTMKNIYWIKIWLKEGKIGNKTLSQIISKCNFLSVFWPHWTRNICSSQQKLVYTLFLDFVM